MPIFVKLGHPFSSSKFEVINSLSPCSRQHAANTAIEPILAVWYLVSYPYYLWATVSTVLPMFYFFYVFDQRLTVLNYLKSLPDKGRVSIALPLHCFYIIFGLHQEWPKSCMSFHFSSVSPYSQVAAAVNSLCGRSTPNSAHKHLFYNIYSPLNS